MRNAVLRAMVQVPTCRLQPCDMMAIQKSLTVFPKDYGGTYGMPDPIRQFTLKGDEVHLPVQWGLNYCRSKGIRVDNELVDGFPASFPLRPDPNHPKAPKGQAQFFIDTLQSAFNSPTSFICAPTGTGKSATFLNTAAELGRTTLVIVHSKELARQWREQEIPRHLGIPKEDVGLIEGSLVNYKGKAIVVAVIHNIIQKEFDQDFYDYFGTIGWDEGHRLGAPAFHESTTKFRAKNKLLFTATPERKDGCTVLLTNYFGHISATSESIPMDCVVRIFGYQITKNYPPAMPRARVINSLARLTARNEEWVKIILSAYREGRNFIGMSDRIEQLQLILQRLCELGVPEQHIGLYTRKFKDAEGKEQTTTKEELAHYREHAKIFLATFQMGKEALDIPRLDAGAALLPTADGVQMLGRINRIHSGKPTPVWFVMRDQGCRHIAGSYHSLIKSLKELPYVTIES